MALEYKLRTFVCDEAACPDFVDGLEVSRGLEAGDVLGEIENQFTVQFNLRTYAGEFLEAMEATRDQVLFELPASEQGEAEAAMNLIINSYAFRLLQWRGSPTALTQAQERQRVWDDIQRFRNEFVRIVNQIIAGAASKFERDVEEAAADSRVRLVVAFVTDSANDPIFLEGEADGFISTAAGNKNFPREALVVYPGFQDRGGEGSDNNIVNVIAEICTPDICPPVAAVVERVFEYSCREDITGELERRPTLTIKWKLPDCCPVAIGQYTILNPPGSIVFSEQIEFIGGNISYEKLLWPGQGWFLTQHIQNISACPMPGATQISLEGRAKTGSVQATGLAGIFSNQMMVTTIVAITGEGDERIITVAGVAGDFKPTDYFDYQVDEEVIVFAVGRDLTLPLNEDREMGDTGLRIIPANFAEFGVQD